MPDASDICSFPRVQVRRVSLLHFEGERDSQVITDESGRVWTLNGVTNNIRISPDSTGWLVTSPAQIVPPVGSAFLTIAGGPADIRTPQDGTLAVNRPFTFSGWFWRYNYGVSAAVVGLDGQAGVHLQHRLIGWDGSGVPFFLLAKASAPTSGYFQLLDTVGYLERWFHWEASLDENWLMRIFVNGRLRGTLQASSDIAAPNMAGTGLIMGRYYDGSSGGIFGVDELSFAYGVEHYEDFTPPTRPLSFPIKGLL